MLTINLRRRSLVGEKIESLHEIFLEKIRHSDEEWNLKSLKPFIAKQNSPVEVLSVTKALPSGASGYITYTARAEAFIYDQSLTDDSIVIDVKEGKIEFTRVKNLFLSYIEAFGAYRAQVLNEQIMLEDFQIINKYYMDYKVEPDGRWGVYRFGACNFFDVKLLNRSLNKSAKEVFSILGETEFKARLIGDGVAFWVDKLPIDIDAWISLDLRLKDLLGIGSKAWTR